MPLAACRVWLLFLIDYRRLFNEALVGNWPYKVHPTVFFTLCFGLFVLGQPLYVHSPLGLPGKVGWFEPWSNLDRPQQAKCLVDLGISPGDIREMLVVEPVYPGSSKASLQVKELTGSMDVADVAAYLRGKDPEIGAAYGKQAEITQQVARYEGWILNHTWGVIVLVTLMVAIPIHLSLLSSKRTFKQTLYIVLYVSAFWWPVCAAVMLIGRFVPLNTYKSLVFAAVEFLLSIATIISWWRTLRYTHGATHLRMVACATAVAASAVLVAFGFSYGLERMARVALPF